MAQLNREGCGQSVVPAAYLSYSSSTDPALSVPANSFANVPWYHFKTTDETVFGTATGPPLPLVVTNLAGDTLIALLKAGVYSMDAQIIWIADGKRHGIYLSFGGGYSVDAVSPAQIFLTSSPTGNGFQPWAHKTWQQNLPRQWGFVQALNKDATTADNVFFAEVAIFYHGPPGTTVQVFG